MLPLLPLTVPCKDCLLLCNQLGGADRLVRQILPFRKLCGKLRFLHLHLSDCRALIVEALFFGFHLRELFPDADDAQKRVRLFAVGCLHEFRQVERQLREEAVKQLLPGTVALRVNNLEGGILTLALDNKPV